MDRNSLALAIKSRTLRGLDQFQNMGGRQLSEPTSELRHLYIGPGAGRCRGSTRQPQGFVRKRSPPRARGQSGSGRGAAHASPLMALNLRLEPGARADPPAGTQLPPNRDLIKALQVWDGQGCLVVDMAPQPAGRVFNASGKHLHGIRVEMKNCE